MPERCLDFQVSEAPEHSALDLPHIFAGDPLDRADHERRDPAWVAERLASPESRFLALWRLQPLVTSDDAPALAWQGREIARHMDPPAEPVLLGLRDGIAHFALDLGDGECPIGEGSMPAGTAFEDPRTIAPHLSQPDSGTLAHAKSVVDWHARHRFCANCGAPTVSRLGGKERGCDDCGASHFPRTDPVAIMLVHHGDRCLLGRSRRRVTSLYSALAGFVDQGETIEEAVRREIREESSVAVGAVRYHSSQPWPFPSSLMIGCLAEALTTEIRIDEHELADVGWFAREEVAAALAAPDRSAGRLTLPGPIAIAHHLIVDWVRGDGAGRA